ncbi:hypothetical protein R1flu_005229 [Riccia fluitans]|uniref:Cytochrome P450 n=1 Tax=Riccia fluitans TaxID=41844 RepID=A0ABD1YSV6_9MARC
MGEADAEQMSSKGVLDFVALQSNSFYTIVVASVVVVLFILKAAWPRKKLAPGPRPRPIVGNLYDMKPLRHRLFLEWAHKYGSIFSFWMGTTLNTVVSTAALAKEVLKDKDQILSGRQLSSPAKMFSRNGQDLIWADYGPHYVKVRKLCTLELFTPKRIEALRSVREEEVTAMVNSIFNDCRVGPGTVNVKTYLSSVAFNNITRIVFGKKFVDEKGELDAQGKEFKAIIHEGMRLGGSLKMTEHIKYLRWMFPLQEDAFARNNARRDALTQAIMHEFAAARDSSSHHHFVDALLKFRKEYDLSEETVSTLLWDMITAGMDTTAITVEWAMAELVRNPEVQRKAQEELDTVVGYERVLTEVDFKDLPFLHAVAKEVLRLHPPAPLMLPHKALEDTTVGGYDVPKGSTVHVSVFAVGRDPNIWKDAETFRPERFLEEDIDIKGTDFRVIPFGAGRRVCPGAQLGLFLVEIMLGRLLHHFSWSPPEGMRPQDVDLTERPGVVNFMAKPLEAVATPRLPSQLYRIG